MVVATVLYPSHILVGGKKKKYSVDYMYEIM